MTAPTTTVIDPRNLLISGGVPAGPPQERDRTGQTAPPRAAVAPTPADESPACREDWHAEVLGTTWLRTPER